MKPSHRKWIKRLTFITAIFPIFIVLGFIGAMQFVDFNRYKPQIEHKVTHQLGLKFKINGDVAVHLYPFGIDLKKVVVYSDARFNNTPIATIKNTQINISLWSLFIDKKIQLSGLELDQPHLYLKINKDGEKNWQPLHKLAQGSPLALKSGFQTVAYQTVSQPANAVDANAPVHPAPKSLIRWKMQNFVITAGAIELHNSQNHEVLKSSDISLFALDIKPQKPFQLTASFNFDNVNQKHHIQSQLNTMVEVDSALKNWTLSDWKGYAQLSLPKKMQIPDSRLNLSGTLLKFNIKTRQFSLQNAHFNFLNTHLTTQLTGQLGKDYKIKGLLNIQDLNVPQILHQMHQKPINFVNQLALNKLNLVTHLNLSPNNIALNQLNLQFDKTHLKGDIWKKGGINPQYRFKLAIDQLNMDAYQVKGEQHKHQKKTAQSKGVITGATATQPVQAPLSKTYLPLAVPVRTLRQLQAQGQLSIGKLQIWQQHYQKVNMTLSAKQGVLDLAPFDANLYQGQLQSQLTLNVLGKTPVYHWRGKAKNIQLAPFLTDGWHNKNLKGTFASYFDFKTEGVNHRLLRQNLNGHFLAKVTNGAVKGLDLNKLLIGKPSKKTDFTNFTEMNVDGKMTQGVYRISKWDVQSSNFAGAGFGQVNLVPATLKAQLKLSIKKAPPTLPQLIGLEVPISLKGALQNPKWTLETQAFLNNPQTQQKILQQIKQFLGK